MGRKSGRKVFLGFQWDTPSWDDVPLWLDYLFEKLDKIPVHWNLPALPSEGSRRKRSSFARSFRAKTEERGDPVTVAGFAAACHPLLNLDELNRELSWALKNPWRTGVTDAFELRPTILIPSLPDFHRPAVTESYRDHGFDLVGFPSSAPFSLAPRGGVRVFPYLRFPARTAGPNDPASRLLRSLSTGSGDLFLVIDLSGLSSLKPLQYALEEAAEPLFGRNESAFSVLSGSPPAAERSKEAAGRVPASDWSLFPTPLVRRKLEASSSLARRKRKKTEDYRQILEALSPAAPPADAEARPAGDAGEDMRLVAHMLGEVVLSGSDFDVALAGGRFGGIVRRGEHLLPRKPASSYIRVAGRTLPFRTRSSFSFEGDRGTGLREELELEDSGSRARASGAGLCIEYSFRDGSPMLSIAGDILYPRFGEGEVVEEYAPLAISLVELPRRARAVIETTAPDGSAGSYAPGDRDGGVIIPGASHRIQIRQGIALLICAAPSEERRWGVLHFRVSRAWGRRILEVNPFGSYAPVKGDALSGRRERFSLLLGLEESR